MKLNLGSGPNPLEGFANLDKENGWLFQDGLPYPDEGVEAITESHALMYVPIEDWPFVFLEIARVLEPGGVVRITQDSTGDPASGDRYQRRRSQNHVVLTTPELVVGYLRAAGLKAARLSENETWFKDNSLIQRFHGHEPYVFHVEGKKPL